MQNDDRRLVERVVRKYDEQRAEGETFTGWVQRAADSDLQ